MQEGLSIPADSATILFNATSQLAPSIKDLLSRPRLLVLEPCAGRGALLVHLAYAREAHAPAGAETVVLACERDPARMRELRAVVTTDLPRISPGFDVRLLEADWLGVLRRGRHADRTPDAMKAWRGVPLDLRRDLVRRGWGLPRHGFDEAFDLVLLHPPWLQDLVIAGRRRGREIVWPAHLRQALELRHPEGGVAAVLPPAWWRHPDAARFVALSSRGFRLSTGTGSSIGEHELAWFIGQEQP